MAKFGIWMERGEGSKYGALAAWQMRGNAREEYATIEEAERSAAYWNCRHTRCTARKVA